MLALNFKPFPDIDTERLNLRRISVNDSMELFRLRTDVDAMRFLDRAKPKSISEIEELIARIENGIETNTAIGWGIYLKNEPRLIAHLGFHRIEKEHYRAEIGYMLHPEFWNRGIMTEAIKQVIGFGFSKMNLHSIEANVNPNNKKSIKLLIKQGFVKEAYFKENYFYDGKFLDSEIYSLLQNNFTGI